MDESVLRDFCDVCDTNGGWVGFAAGSSTGDYGDVTFFAFCYEMCFLNEEVDGIYYEVVFFGENSV